MELEYEWWEYLLIPFISAILGYGTNALALEMTLAPLEFVGIEIWRPWPDEPYGFFGWQGVIPVKAKKMAGITFDLLTRELFDLKKIFGRIDPQKFSEVMEDPLLLMMDTVLEEVAMEYMPNVWKNLPQSVKDDLVITAEQECKPFMAESMGAMQAHIEDMVDLKKICVDAVVENKAMLVRIFKEVGDKEFIFLRRSGFYFGFLFGIGQMVMWFFYSAAWIFPVAGFIVGWFTNYMALKLIFAPLEPKQILCWKVQGIFLQRQHEVSEVFSRCVMTEILDIKAIWHAIFTGPRSSNFFAILRAQTLTFTDRLVAEIKPIAIAAMGAEEFAQLKEALAQKVMAGLPGIIDKSYEYMQETLDMENTVREELQKISAHKFERLLHPAFEEDEIQLIAVGGFLGAAVGVLQIFTIFS